MVSKSGKHNLPEEETQEMCPIRGECEFLKNGDNWLNSKALQMGGVLVGLLLTACVSFFVYISGLETRVKLLEENRNQFAEIKAEIKADIKEIKSDILQIKLQISKIEKDTSK